jgi:hypothetical protein
MSDAALDIRQEGRATSRRRVIASVGFAALTLGVSVLLARRLTHTSWPLERAHMGLVGGAVALYFMSYVLGRSAGEAAPPPAAAGPLPTSCGAAAQPTLILPSGWTTWSRSPRCGGSRRQDRAGGDRVLDHLARARRCSGLPTALDSATATGSSGFRAGSSWCSVSAPAASRGRPASATVPFIARPRLAACPSCGRSSPRNETDEILAWFSWAAGRRVRPEACCCWQLSEQGSRQSLPLSSFAWPPPRR